MMNKFSDKPTSEQYIIVDIYARFRKYYTSKIDWEIDLKKENTTSSVGESVLAENIRITIDHSRLPKEDIDQYGQELTKMLFEHTKLRNGWAEATGSANNKRLRLRLHLSMSNDSSTVGQQVTRDILWETLRDPKTNEPLARKELTPFSRFPSSPDTREWSLPLRPALKALMVVANPTDLREYILAPIDVALEVERVSAAFDKIPVSVIGKWPCAVAQRATLEQIIGQMSREKYHILYLVCHGGTKNEPGDKGETYLFLEGDDGTVKQIAGSELTTRIKGVGNPPVLIILTACTGAGGSSQSNWHTAVAPKLAQSGVPAVIAMQDTVWMKTVEAFVPKFIESLMQDGQVDRAINVARNFIDDQWWVPVLFLRSKDGQIWHDMNLSDEELKQGQQLIESMPTEKAVAVAEPESTQQPLASMPTATTPGYAVLPDGSYMPYPANKRFVGRDQELRKLAEILQGDAALAQPVITVITGAGGMGKTPLAVEFVHRYGRYFAGGVFWLDFARPETIKQQVAACGGPGRLNLFRDNDELNIDERVNLVQARWATNLPCLIIFDNCDDVGEINSAQLLEEWMPKSGASRVLVTSRRQHWDDEEINVQLLQLEELKRNESIALLREDRPDDSFDAELNLIAEALGDLPLALELAGSYLKRYKKTIKPARYREELLARHILEHDSLTGKRDAHERNVAKTFAISYDQLQSDNDALARALLARAAYFFPFDERIPENLLLATCNPSVDPLDFEDALIRLAELGLVQRLSDQHIRIPRLLATYVRLATNDPTARTDVIQVLCDEMRTETDLMSRRDLAFQLLRLHWLGDVGTPFPNNIDSAVVLIFTDLIDRQLTAPEHRHYLADRIAALQEAQPGALSDHQAVRLFVIRAAMLAQLGHYDQAQEAYIQTLQILDRIPDTARLPDDNRVRAQAGLGLGNLAGERAAKLPKDEATQYLQEAVAHYEAAVVAAEECAQDDILTTNILTELSYAYGLLQRWSDAETTYLKAEAIVKQQVAAQQDPQTAVNCYARVLETASLVQWLHGQRMTELGFKDQAMDRYVRAYDLAKRELTLVQDRLWGETERLYWANLNAGDYLFEIYDVPIDVYPPGIPPDLLTEACRHWRHAEQMALRLNDNEKLHDVRARLDERCRTD